MMKTKIILPNDEEQRKLINNALDDFTRQIRASWEGYDALSESHKELLRDVFVAGYVGGHNDCLGVIRGQLEAIDIVVDFNKTVN